MNIFFPLTIIISKFNLNTREQCARSELDREMTILLNK